ncbi:hypothetical protein D3C71_1803790 [compost metagenome]
MNEPERRSVRTDDETRDDIAQDHRLFEPMKQHGHHARHQHDHCQILNETDGMHGEGSLMAGY